MYLMSATKMNPRYLGILVDALPANVEVEVTFTNRSGVERTHRLLTRDLPHTSRRLTNLDSGTEVYDFESLLRGVSTHAAGPVAVSFSLSTEVSR